MSSLKQKIHATCLSILNKKMEELHSALALAAESANNETKSSAGDKHETSRAMMQLEQEKLGKQLKELEDRRTELEKIDISKSNATITKGSLVESDRGFLFVSIGLGKVIVDGTNIFVISPQSPLGKLLIGKKEKEAVEMNGVKYSINKIN